ncbi:MAG: hypothetical protein WCX12_01710 [Candidatus Paceibacterota bacterium]|jgi:hypothetical protein
MTKQWGKVTWYSKLLALILFIGLPFVGFYLGFRYGEIREKVQLDKNLVSGIAMRQVTYKNSEFEFKYPEVFGVTVWKPDSWPPVVKVVSSKDFSIQKFCSGDFSLDSEPKASGEGVVGGGTYTLYKSSGAGAGTLYSNFCYVIPSKEKYYVLDFLIRSHTGCGDGGCGAYCETQFESECRKLDRNRDIEKPIQDIVSSFKLF